MGKIGESHYFDLENNVFKKVWNFSYFVHSRSI